MFELDKSYYREVEIDYLQEFVKKALSKRTKKLLTIKEPRLGKDRDKIFIGRHNFRALIQLYTMFPTAVNDNFIVNVRMEK